MFNFISVCSGIEAASVAWGPLGAKAVAFAEIDAAPSAVLAHHWPEVLNVGDMTILPELVESGLIEAPDVLVGGTPCQAFSVAGLRKGLSDDRGQLSLTYVELADAIDRKRKEIGREPCVTVWENVPGVLSSKDNAFGCFLGALCGEDVPLVPAGGKWTLAGCVFGPQRTVAWRVLDAQFFGVAQRRRRVFVVASARDGFDPCEVLFESDGLRRDIAPRREAVQVAAPDAPPRATTASHWDDPSSPHPTLSQSHNTGGIGASNQELFSQRGAGFRMEAFGQYAQDETSSTMKARDYKGATDLVVAAFAENSRAEVRLQYGDGGICGPLTLGGGKAGQGTPMEMTYGIPGNWIGRKPENGGNAVEPMHNVAPCLTATDRHGGATPLSVALRGREGGATAELGGEVAGALRASSGGGDKPHVLAEMAVRRLTPTECARLQGFPDDHCRIPWRGKPAGECPDGLQYKAYGNSMAVPVMAWLGKRIINEMTK